MWCDRIEQRWKMYNIRKIDLQSIGKNTQRIFLVGVLIALTACKSDSEIVDDGANIDKNNAPVLININTLAAFIYADSGKIFNIDELPSGIYKDLEGDAFSAHYELNGIKVSGTSLELNMSSMLKEIVTDEFGAITVTQIPVDATLNTTPFVKDFSLTGQTSVITNGAVVSLDVKNYFDDAERNIQTYFIKAGTTVIATSTNGAFLFTPDENSTTETIVEAVDDFGLLVQTPGVTYTTLALSPPSPSPSPPPTKKDVYPSTSTAWVIPGYHADTYDSLGYPITTKDELIDWELNHADIAFGSNYGKSAEDKIKNLGYMYVQKIDFSPGSLEFDLMDQAESAGDNYEDYFLHFSEDTTVRAEAIKHSIYTPLNRRPWIVGWTQSDVHSGSLIWERPPYEVQPFKNSEDGGAVFVFMPEKFDQIEIVLKKAATTGQLLLQYPSGIDAMTGVVNQWTALNPGIVDGTNDLRTTGVVSWVPPSDWVKAATYDPTNRIGSFFGNKHLQAGRKGYIIKLDRVGEDVNDQPVVEDIMIKDFMPFTDEPNKERLIRGWDPDNDKNDDGYLDDTELENLFNINASARFRYESRVTPLGNMWSEVSEFQRPDFLNLAYQEAIANVVNKRWAKSGLAGAYNDDAFKLLNVTVVDTGIGGKTKEHGLPVDGATFQGLYQQAFLGTIKKIKTKTSSPYVAANTSAENLFYLRNNRVSYIEPFSTFLREDFIRPGLGLDGYFGIAKMWDSFALSALDKKNIIIAHAGWTGSIPIVHTKEAWEARIATGLAMYYLVNVPGKTFYTSWNSSYNYGSMNTVAGNFYKAGVPKNIAYQPSLMLAVDIGKPAGSILTWPGQTATPLIYTAKTGVADYTAIGDSTQSFLTNPAIGTVDQAGSLAVVPSYMYYAFRSERELTLDGTKYPSEMVIARDYTNAIVLYQTNFFGGDPSFMSVTRELTLPGNYQRLNYDGTLQAASNKISLTGYEGAILLKAD